MRICHQLGAMLSQFRAEIAAVEAGEPEFVRFYSGISAADHLKFQVGDDVLEWHGRMLKEILITLSAGFFASKKDKEHSPFRRFFMGQNSRQLENSDAPGSVIVRAVVDVVTIDGLADANMVHVGGEKNDLIFQFLVAAFKSADYVAGIPLLFAFAKEIELAGNILNVAAIIAGRLDTDFAQLRSQIGGSEQFVVRAAGASLHGVTRKKLHGATDLGLIWAGFLGGCQGQETKKTDE